MRGGKSVGKNFYGGAGVERVAEDVVHGAPFQVPFQV